MAQQTMTTLPHTLSIALPGWDVTAAPLEATDGYSVIKVRTARGVAVTVELHRQGQRVALARAGDDLVGVVRLLAGSDITPSAPAAEAPDTYILREVRRTPGVTAAEIAPRINYSPERTRSRVAAMVRDGRLKRVDGLIYEATP